MSKETKTIKLRLALRHEGDFWNAYMAEPDTMEGAKLIGCILIGAVRKDEELKNVFMAMMQQVMGQAIKDLTGEEPKGWDIDAAPESERSGHA
jgi:hypothetical protein